MIGAAYAAQDRTISARRRILILLCGVAHNLDQLVLVGLHLWLLSCCASAQAVSARKPPNSIVTCDNFFIFGFSLIGVAGNGSPAAYWGVAGER